MDLIIESHAHGRHVVLIDDWLWPFIKHWKWGINKKRSLFYCGRNAWINKKQKPIELSRFILGVSDSSIHVDHITHNTLDNRTSNIRECSPSQNSYNKRKIKKNGIPFKGVHIDKRGSKTFYRAEIGFKYKKNKLGRFPFTGCGLLCAALAYDKVALEVHMDFACLNFI